MIDGEQVKMGLLQASKMLGSSREMLDLVLMYRKQEGPPLGSPSTVVVHMLCWRPKGGSMLKDSPLVPSSVC